MSAISSRVNTVLLLLLVLMAGTIIAILATRASGGPLDPPLAPASTLPQVEPRTPISSLPFTISQPGSYFVTRDLTLSGAVGVTITASNVTLDLNGFTLRGGGPAQAQIGVSAGVGHDVTIEHGSLEAFGFGILAGNAEGVAIRDIGVFSNSTGIVAGPYAVVEDCRAQNNTGIGLDIRDGVRVARCEIVPNPIGVKAQSHATIDHNRINNNNPGGVQLNGTQNTVVDNDINCIAGCAADITSVGGDNIIIRNRVQTCTSISILANDYAPIVKLAGSGVGSLAEGREDTNIAWGPGGAGLC